jgi:hypothetical protein
MKRLDFAQAIHSTNAGRITLTPARLFNGAQVCRRVLKRLVRLRASTAARP